MQDLIGNVEIQMLQDDLNCFWLFNLKHGLIYLIILNWISNLPFAKSILIHEHKLKVLKF